MIASILPALIGLMGKTIDRAVPDKDKAADLKKELTLAALNLNASQLQSATSIILAEAQGGSWLQRNWRPLLMLAIIMIIVNNYLLYPYISLFWTDAPLLDLPEELWGLMKIGVGGYVTGRTVEKAVKTYSDRPDTEKNMFGK